MTQDKKELIAILKVNGFKLQDLPDELKDDLEIVSAALSSNGANMLYASEKLKDDKNLALFAVKNNSSALMYVSPRLKDDEDVVREAVRKDGRKLKYASQRLKKNKEFAILAVKNCGEALEYVDVTLRKDKDVLMEAVKEDCWSLIHAKEVLGDLDYKDIILVALRQSSKIYLYLNGPLKEDPDVTEFAKLQEKFELEREETEKRNIEAREEARVEQEKTSAREKVKSNLEKEKAIQVLRYNGLALKDFASLNDDEDVVREAVKSNGRALEFASERLKGDENIASLAISEDVRAFDFVSPSLKADPRFLKKYNYFKEADDRKYTEMPPLPKENSPMSAFIGEYQEADLDKFIDGLNSKQTNHL